MGAGNRANRQLLRGFEKRRNRWAFVCCGWNVSAVARRFQRRCGAVARSISATTAGNAGMRHFERRKTERRNGQKLAFLGCVEKISGLHSMSCEIRYCTRAVGSVKKKVIRKAVLGNGCGVC